MEEEQLIVDGFTFAVSQTAELAQTDVQRIEQLEQKLNYGNLDAVAMVYVKSIQNELFHTVVGFSYLKRLQLYLIEQGYGKIDFRKYPIPAGEGDGQPEQAAWSEKDASDERRLKIRTNYQQELKQKLRTSRWVNILLVLAVIVLFVIALTGENANIINYRYNIQNEYSEWQKQLQERERAVSDREKAVEEREQDLTDFK
ncbi:MAG: hypothetical protein IJ711_01240 [Lachnospiraceae bacterium]|nr:hypothetical protein [Lachnospiraceae bacterium]